MEQETIRYYLTRDQNGVPVNIWALVTTPMGQQFEFFCTPKRQWKPDNRGRLTYQLLVMPDLGFRGEISAEKVVRLGFPLLTPEVIVEDPW